MSKTIPDVAIVKNRLNDNVDSDQTASTERLAQQNGFLTKSAIGIKLQDVNVKHQDVKVSNIIGNYSIVILNQPVVEH